MGTEKVDGHAGLYGSFIMFDKYQNQTFFLVLHQNLRRARGKAEDFNGLHTWVHVRLLFVSMNVPFVDEMLSWRN